jgi:hypothetical protein
VKAIMATNGERKIALVTGITGQDGSYLAELLLEKGYSVSVMMSDPVLSKRRPCVMPICPRTVFSRRVHLKLFSTDVLVFPLSIGYGGAVFRCGLQFYISCSRRSSFAALVRQGHCRSIGRLIHIIRS